VPNPRLAEKAHSIAAYLQLPLDIEDVGLGELEARLEKLIAAPHPARFARRPPQQVGR
jgi:hypothetical protein